MVLTVKFFSTVSKNHRRWSLMDANKAHLAFCTASCFLPVQAAFQNARLSFLLIHLDLRTHIHTLCHSLSSNPGWNWAPYLLHCPLNDAVSQRDKDASQDGYQRPKHSSDYQPAPSVTAVHGCVCFSPSEIVRPSICVAACSPSVSVFVECAFMCSLSVFVSRQQHREAVPSEEMTEQPRPGKGTDTSGSHTGAYYKWS